MKRISYFGFAFALVGLTLGFSANAQNSGTGAQVPPQAAAAAAQAPDQPLGDYARKVHSKDADAAKPKPKVVFDNDNLPTDDKISVVGPQPPQTAAEANAKPADSKDAQKEEDAKRQDAWKSWHDKVASQKDAVDLATRELDVLQREYQLRAAEMYADAGNRLRNSGEWDKQDADYKQKIADKQKALADAKQKLSDMQEEARKAGVPSSQVE
jgi:hypothetical protein